MMDEDQRADKYAMFLAVRLIIADLFDTYDKILRRRNWLQSLGASETDLQSLQQEIRDRSLKLEWELCQTNLCLRNVLNDYEDTIRECSTEDLQYELRAAQRELKKISRTTSNYRTGAERDPYCRWKQLLEELAQEIEEELSTREPEELEEPPEDPLEQIRTDSRAKIELIRQLERDCEKEASEDPDHADVIRRVYRKRIDAAKAEL